MSSTLAVEILFVCTYSSQLNCVEAADLLQMVFEGEFSCIVG